MSTIQSGMLIALGFLAAVLLGLMVAPAFWSRAVRLTTRRIKQSMPLSEMEIAADRDRIRAEYAIKMHKLETLVDQVKMAAARQQIELNRRDARVNMLEADLERLHANHEEAQNARRVLEQTIAERLPKVETRLTDAKKLLHSRDREITELTRTADRQKRALAEASSINTQQQSEIDRLGSSLASRMARSATGIAQQSESEAALRSELEALRAKTREQAQLLARMQSFAGRAAAGQPRPADGVERVVEKAKEPAVVATSTEHDDLERQLRAMKARNDDQAGEIARLKAAIAVFESEDSELGKVSIRDSRIGLKARVQSIEAQSNRQMETIQKLRSELAAANERLARQADHFTGQLRRLGSTGGTGASRERRGQDAPPTRAGLAERVAMAQQAAEPKAGEPVEASHQPQSRVKDGKASPLQEAAAAMQIEKDTASTGIEQNGASNGRPSGSGDVHTAGASDQGRNDEKESTTSAAPASGRPRLLDRIAGLSRST